MNERQHNIYLVLRERSQRLAGMYQTALQNLLTPAEVGCESARISVICHCIRELMMGLQTAMIDDPIERVRPSSGELTRQLREMAANHPELDLEAEQDMVPVPKIIARKLGSLIGAARKEHGRNRDNAAALVTGSQDRDRSHPAVNEWLEIYNKFFVRWAHIASHQERELPTDAELLTSIKVVEDVIEVRTAVFFENVSALEKLLAEINAPVEETA